MAVRVSKRRVIAVCGATCVGKTTIAKLLATALGWEHRDCGREVGEAARRMGQSVGELPIDVHREVDDETRRCAMRAGGGVVMDGRYLRYVLVGVADVTMVELTCSNSVRAGRWVERGRQGAGKESVATSDRADEKLCVELYECEPRSADCTLDTEVMSPEDTVTRLRREVGA